MNFYTGPFHHKRKQVIDYIKEQKAQGKFTVIDIGGEADSWASEISDMIVDIKPLGLDKAMMVDICRADDVNKLLDYVKEKGKFDYAICSHTLEDVYNPYLMLDKLPEIAYKGIIFVPTCYTEMSKAVSNAEWLGYIHHRYMYKELNGKILVMAKMPFLEKRYNFGVIEQELGVEWEEHIDYIDIYDAFPYWDVKTMIEAYEKALT